MGQRAAPDQGQPAIPAADAQADARLPSSSLADPMQPTAAGSGAETVQPVQSKKRKSRAERRRETERALVAHLGTADFETLSEKEGGTGGVIRCKVCGMMVTASRSAGELHARGSKHLKRKRQRDDGATDQKEKVTTRSAEKRQKAATNEASGAQSELLASEDVEKPVENRKRKRRKKRERGQAECTTTPQSTPDAPDLTPDNPQPNLQKDSALISAPSEVQTEPPQEPLSGVPVAHADEQNNTGDPPRLNTTERNTTAQPSQIPESKSVHDSAVTPNASEPISAPDSSLDPTDGKANPVTECSGLDKVFAMDSAAMSDHEVNDASTEPDRHGFVVGEPSEHGAAVRKLLAQTRSSGARHDKLRAETTDFIPLDSRIDEERHDNDDDSFGRAEEGELEVDMFVPGTIPPWVSGDRTKEAIAHSSDPMVALHYEILDFERFMSPTANEHAARERLVEKVTKCVKATWPEAEIKIFGSFATGLYLPSSDVDICVMNTGEETGENVDENLQYLADAIRDKDFVKRIRVIQHAKVPLVKIVDKESDVQCDISFGRPNGPDNVPLIKTYLSAYPGLRPLLLVIKCFLHQRGLNEVYRGGLGSYTVFLMVTSHLQMWHKNFPLTRASLGNALVDFFDLYSRRFNYVNLSVRIKNGGGYFPKDEQYGRDPSQPDLLSIEDPQDATNELGRNSYSIANVRKSFGFGFTVLRKWTCDAPGASPTPLNCILRVDQLIWNRKNYVALELEEGRRL